MNPIRRQLNTTETGDIACAHGEPWAGEHPLCAAKVSVCEAHDPTCDWCQTEALMAMRHGSLHHQTGRVLDELREDHMKRMLPEHESC